MYLNENIAKLKRKFAYIRWDALLQMQENADAQISVETSRKGIDTLKVCIDGTVSYLHSKYDPLSEAERIADTLELNREDQHLLFYGIGLGYVIDVIREKNPHLTFSIYEPNPLIFLKFICCRKLSEEFLEALSSIYVEGLALEQELGLFVFLQDLEYNIKPVILPSYERIYAEGYNSFCHKLKDSIVDKRFKVGTRYFFEKIWMHNTMDNFPYTIMSGNILDMPGEVFGGKPAVLVASGPSLDEEIENLRRIKKEGLAYIFSAGSAVYKLVKHDILPDAICAIDGGANNHDLYKVLFENPGNKIPLIYADMVYSEVVSSYNAKRFNIILENDQLASYYLKYKSDKEVKKMKIVPSVALVLLQIMNKLQCDPIILVGQNFALKNEYYYATGIDFHKNRQSKEKITENEKNEAFQVEDVNGNKVFTLKDLDMMRRNMEILIKSCSINNIINTTNGGAKIDGTKYMPLSELINERLNTSVVNPNWYEIELESYDLEYVAHQHKLMVEESNSIYGAIEKVEKELKKMEGAVNNNNKNKISKLLSDFIKISKELTRNEFYKTFILPMNSLQIELLTKRLKRIAREEDMIKKGMMALEGYKEFVNGVKSLLKEIEPYFQKFSRKIESYYDDSKQAES